MLIACGQPSYADSSTMAPPTGLDWIYTARAGDTVQSVAQTYLLQPERWTDLLRHNKLRNDGFLTSGTILKIPVSLLKNYPKPATLLETSGQVWYRKAFTHSYVPAIKGLKLSVGDEIKTLQGKARIVFADGSKLRINSKSIIIFNKLTHFGETGMVDVRLRLNKGGIKTRVTPRKGPASRYEVSTPSAVAAVRGTSFRIRVIDAYTITEVTEGRVQVENASSDALLQKGQGISVTSGGNLQPVKLLPPPLIRGLPDTIGKLPLTISWQAIQGAKSYRIEVFRNDPHALPLISERRQTNSLSLKALANGKYWLNVWAVDMANIEGLVSNLHFIVDQRATPAVLKNPLTGAAITNSTPEFSWQLNNPQLLSSLEIAQDRQFSKLYAKTAFNRQQTATVERPLAAGQYYWRVVTQAGSEHPAYSEPRLVTINDSLKATRVVAISYFRDQAKIFWKSVDHAEHYLVQLAEDEDFKVMVKQDTLQKNSALLRLIPGKSYWVRVKAVGNRFYSSSFDQPQMLKIQP